LEIRATKSIEHLPVVNHKIPNPPVYYRNNHPSVDIKDEEVIEGWEIVDGEEKEKLELEF